MGFGIRKKVLCNQSASKISEYASGELVWSLINDTKVWPIRDIVESLAFKVRIESKIVEMAVKFFKFLIKKRLSSSCKESKCKQLNSIVLFAVFTGIRKGKIINLSWCDIDFDEELIELEKTKNGDKRYVHPKNPILVLLKEKAKETLHHPSSYIFASPNSGKPTNFTSSWNNVLSIFTSIDSIIKRYSGF